MTSSNEQRLRMLASPVGRPKVVLDTDTYNEIDDQFALVQMMLSPDRFDVQAIYAAPFHNARSSGPGQGMELSYEEILRLLTRIGVPPTGLVHRGVTEFVGLRKQARSGAAVDDLIARARRASPTEPLYVIAIGAISNVASAILDAPDIVERIVVVWLSGNAPDWPKEFEQRANFNLKQDVGAAQVVLDSEVPLVFVPAMPVTSHLHASVAEIERYVEPHGDIGAFLAQRFKAYNADHVGWTKRLWDMAAVGWMLNPAWCPSFIRPTPILRDDMQWVDDPSRHAMRYVGFVDRDPIMRDFFTKLAAFAARSPRVPAVNIESPKP